MKSKYLKIMIATTLLSLSLALFFLFNLNHYNFSIRHTDNKLSETKAKTTVFQSANTDVIYQSVFTQNSKNKPTADFIRHLMQYISENPSLANDQVALIMLLYYNNYQQLAKQLIEPLIFDLLSKNEVIEIEVFQILREIYIHEGNIDKYTILIESISDLYMPKNDILSETAMYYYNNNYIDAAYNLLNANLHKNPDNMQLRFALASILTSQGNYDAAISEYKTIIDGSENPSAYFKLGKIYLSVGQQEMAQQVFEKTMSLSPNYTDDIKQLIENNRL